MTNEKENDQKQSNQNQTCQNNVLIKNNLISYLEDKLKKSEEEILEKKLNAEAEILKIYTRSNREIENFKKFCLEKIMIDFLVIPDSIQCALDVIKQKQSEEIYIEIDKKINYVNNLLKEIFKAFNVKKIEEINVQFNPDIHQAMSISYNDKIKSNQIVKVMQPGYLLNESRLLRPSMVMVSKEKI